MTKIKKVFSNTTTLTFVAMILGAIFGIIFGDSMSGFKFIGSIWLDSIKMIVVPLVFCIMVPAVAEQEDVTTLGRVAMRTLAYYMVTSAMAGVVGIAVALIMKPGLGVSIAGLVATEVKSAGGVTVEGFITSLFSDNMFGTFSSGNVLQTLVIAIFMGFAILKMKNLDHKEFILKIFNSANGMISAYINMIIKFAPIGVFFLIADSFGAYGFSILGTMAGFIGTFWLGILLLMFIVYGASLWIFAKMNVFTFLKKSMPVWMFAIASCSSSASVPVVIKSATEEFDIPDGIAKFGLTIGSQINSGGSCILYPALLVFISQLYDIPLEFGTFIQMVLVAVIIASSGGGIPGSGIVKMLIIVEMFGFPVEVVGILAGFYRFIDMGTTSSNVLGDLVGTVCVSKWEDRTLAREKKRVKSA